MTSTLHNWGRYYEAGMRKGPLLQPLLVSGSNATLDGVVAAGFRLQAAAKMTKKDKDMLKHLMHAKIASVPFRNEAIITEFLLGWSLRFRKVPS